VSAADTPAPGAPDRWPTTKPTETAMKDRHDSPKSADEQDTPEPVRPTNPQEEKGRGPEDKPSQAEGERDKAG